MDRTKKSKQFLYRRVSGGWFSGQYIARANAVWNYRRCQTTAGSMGLEPDENKATDAVEVRQN